MRWKLRVHAFSIAKSRSNTSSLGTVSVDENDSLRFMEGMEVLERSIFELVLPKSSCS